MGGTCLMSSDVVRLSPGSQRPLTLQCCTAGPSKRKVESARPSTPTPRIVLAIIPDCHEEHASWVVCSEIASLPPRMTPATYSVTGPAVYWTLVQ